MSFTIRELAALVHGQILGDGDLVIQSARTLKTARPGDITFVENGKHGARLEESQASAALVPTNRVVPGKTLIQVADPLAAFIEVFKRFHAKPTVEPAGIDPRAVIHPAAQIGPETSVGPFARIGQGTVVGPHCRIANGVTIGANCRLGTEVVLHPGVVLYDETVLGDRVIVHANAVLGADGFGYRFQQGRHVKVPHLCNLIVGNDVEIGACSCIDRGAFEPTIIGDGTKIDNLVQIGHNCRIGKHNAIAAQVGIAGSTTTGNYVLMGGQVGIGDHLHIGDGAMIGAKSGIVENVKPGQRMFLYPGHEEKRAGRIIACIKKLPDMRRDLLRVLKALDMNGVDEAREAA